MRIVRSIENYYLLNRLNYKEKSIKNQGSRGHSVIGFSSEWAFSLCAWLTASGLFIS